jgi:hypothetical protein
MRLELVSATPLLFDDGTPVRAASGITAYDGGWLVVQDDATHACLWRDGRGERRRLLSPVQGHDVFDESAGTKALKPDLEACTTLPDGRTLVLGSGSTPARMRSVLLSPESVRVAALGPVVERVAEALEVGPDALNLEGACVVGDRLRWFQRGLPVAGVPSASVDLPLGPFLDAVSGRDAALRVGGVLRYDLGSAGDVPLAITDAVARPDRTVLVSAVAEDSASTYDDGPLAGSALAVLDGERVVELAELPLVDGAPAKVEGLALDGDDLVAVVDADDPRLASLLLRLRVA